MQKCFFTFLVTLTALFIKTSGIEAHEWVLDGGAGYRQDRFVWELAGPHDIPAVMSRLTWENIGIFELSAYSRIITDCNVYIRACGDYGWIMSGHNRDSDYTAHRRTGQTIEFLRSSAKSNKGNVWDLSGGLGYCLNTCIAGLRVAPLAGYSYHRQCFWMHKGKIEIDLSSPEPEGRAIAGLNSSYKTSWQGPWIGADALYWYNCNLLINGSLEYHRMKFNAAGHWNLRQDFADDFRHDGWGNGLFSALGINYYLCEGWHVGGLLTYRYSWIENGRDCTPVINEDDDGNVFIIDYYGKLKSIRWQSFSVILTAGYEF